MIINEISYKTTQFGRGFSILPDWLMSTLDIFKLKPVDRLLYLCLYQHADISTGICYPSYKVLKKYTGIKNNSSIKQGLDKLVQIGLIDIIQKGYYSDGINKANTYKVRYLYLEN